MKTLIVIVFLLLCTSVARADCTVSLSTVAAPPPGAAISTNTITQFKVNTICINESDQIIPMDSYIKDLKNQKKNAADQVTKIVESSDKVSEKILEAEAIRAEVEKAARPVSVDPEPIFDPVNP